MCSLACFFGVVIYSALGRRSVCVGGLSRGVDCRLVGWIAIGFLRWWGVFLEKEKFPRGGLRGFSIFGLDGVRFLKG